MADQRRSNSLYGDKRKPAKISIEEYRRRRNLSQSLPPPSRPQGRSETPPLPSQRQNATPSTSQTQRNLHRRSSSNQPVEPGSSRGQKSARRRSRSNRPEQVSSRPLSSSSSSDDEILPRTSNQGVKTPSPPYSSGTASWPDSSDSTSPFYDPSRKSRSNITNQPGPSEGQQNVRRRSSSSRPEQASLTEGQQNVRRRSSSSRSNQPGPSQGQQIVQRRPSSREVENIQVSPDKIQQDRAQRGKQSRQSRDDAIQQAQRQPVRRYRSRSLQRHEADTEEAPEQRRLPQSAGRPQRTRRILDYFAHEPVGRARSRTPQRHEAAVEKAPEQGQLPRSAGRPQRTRRIPDYFAREPVRRARSRSPARHEAEIEEAPEQRRLPRSGGRPQRTRRAPDFYAREPARAAVIPRIVLRQNQNDIPKAPMQRLVHEIANDLGPAVYRFQATSIGALHIAAETRLVELMEDANILAIHAKRKTVMLRDIQIADMFYNKYHNPN